MARKKTDYRQLREIGIDLEEYAKINLFPIKRCNEYQWNIENPLRTIIIAVYPGSGVIYLPKASYDGTGIVDKTGYKYRFSNAKEMRSKLDEILFAEDAI